ncbi:MAG: lactonase family protein [Planctomycetia bacterium]|nr:lactonase family protein [Planctomycetia bacterium]
MRHVILPMMGIFLSCVLAHAGEEKMQTFYVGTMNAPTGNPEIAPSEGIYRVELNRQTGELQFRGLAGKAKGPGFIVKHPTLGVYYTVSGNEDGTSKEGLVIAWKKESDGSLSRINTMNSGGLGACHLAVSPCGKFLGVANYSSGQLTMFSLAADGSLEKLTETFTFEGHGPNAARQEKPHAHYFHTDNAGKFAICCDLGTDRIHLFQYDSEKNQWIVHPNQPFATVASGAGPRHAIFAPGGEYLYVLNELSCTLEAFLYSPEKGTLTSVQTSPTLPVGFQGINKAAAIDIHPSGKFLYVSNRGANLITVFAVDPTPIRGDKHASGIVLEPIQYVPSGGDAPRFIGLDPTGEFLFSCNKKTHNIVLYRVNQETGKLTETGQNVILPWPVGMAPGDLIDN